MGITGVITAQRSPWQNAYVERVIGSMRSECLDHIAIFNERHLRRILFWYAGEIFNGSWPLQTSGHLPERILREQEA
jgi:transposase InsO family protein